MIYFVFSIIVTILLYAIVFYMSFIAVSILHRGIMSKQVLPVIRTSIFILLCYISIISDVIFFQGALYTTVLTKNGLLLLLVVASFINSKVGKETKDDSRE